MDGVTFKHDLWDSVMSIDIKERRSDDTISVRCPFCGDTKKHKKHTHFYINIDKKKEDSPIFYKCFLCNASGILTPDILKMIDVYDISINSEMRAFNKSIRSTIRRMGFKDNILKIKVPLAEDTQANRDKLTYINERLGLKLTFEDAKNLKIIFDFREFLVKNDIEELTCSLDKAKDLDKNYIGFLSVRNESINFRKVFDSKYKRYEKYLVFKGLDQTRKFYSVGGSLDLLSSEPCEISIAEGPFDALGILYHVQDGDYYNRIVVAATGSGFKSVVQYFVNMGIIGDHIVINLYVDNEEGMTNDYYDRQIGYLKHWFGSINIIRNELRKDMGEPKQNISLIKNKI